MESLLDDLRMQALEAEAEKDIQISQSKKAMVCDALWDLGGSVVLGRS